MDLQRAKEKVDYALEIGKPEVAVELLKEIIREAPDDPYFLTSLARAYHDMDQIPQAKEAILDSLRVDPEFFWSHGIYAIILESEENFDQAQKEYEIGLELNPESNMILYSYADFLYFHRDDYENAEKYARRLIELNPEHEHAFMLLGNILRQLDQDAEVGEMYKQALRLNPESAEVHFEMGRFTLHINENPKQAFEHLRNAIRLNPESDEIRESFFLALKAKNKAYWLFWKYSLMITKLGRFRIAFIAVIWIAIQSLKGVARHNPELMPFILPIVIVYALFCLYTWMAEPVFNLFIRKGWIR